MTTERNPFEGWQEEVANDPLVFDESAAGLEREARGNCWSFSISQDQAHTLTVDDVLVFLSVVEQARERQIRERPGTMRPMVFYCWFDEQACQLRFSLVSVSHNCLPFGAEVEETGDLARIIENFLYSPYHSGIPLEEFIMEDGSEEAGGGEVSRPPLLVWTKTLPTAIDL